MLISWLLGYNESCDCDSLKEWLSNQFWYVCSHYLVTDDGFSEYKVVVPKHGCPCRHYCWNWGLGKLWTCFLNYQEFVPSSWQTSHLTGWYSTAFVTWMQYIVLCRCLSCTAAFCHRALVRLVQLRINGGKEDFFGELVLIHWFLTSFHNLK